MWSAAALPQSAFDTPMISPNAYHWIPRWVYSAPRSPPAASCDSALLDAMFEARRSAIEVSEPHARSFTRPRLSRSRLSDSSIRSAIEDDVAVAPTGAAHTARTLAASTADATTNPTWRRRERRGDGTRTTLRSMTRASMG